MTLRIERLSYQFQKKTLLEDICLHLDTGKLYGILGPNGAGKSTFLKILAGIWKPTEGTFTWKGKDFQNLSIVEKSRLTTLVPQNPSIYFEFTAYEMVAMGCYLQKNNSFLIQEVLQKVDAWHLRFSLMSHLSGGERQRIYIARSLVTEAPIVLLDEHTSDLDVKHQIDSWRLLKNLVTQDKLVIVAVHDLLAAAQFCDEIILLHQGKCIAQGPYHSTLTPKRLSSIFELTAEDSKQIGFT